jgi:hypothetical protein
VLLPAVAACRCLLLLRAAQHTRFHHPRRNHAGWGLHPALPPSKSTEDLAGL